MESLERNLRFSRINMAHGSDMFRPSSRTSASVAGAVPPFAARGLRRVGREVHFRSRAQGIYV